MIAISNIKNPIKAIHAFCVQCYGSRDVAECTSYPGSRYPCPLYPFRTGKNPFRAERTEAQKEAALQNAEKLKAYRKANKSIEE